MNEVKYTSIVFIILSVFLERCSLLSWLLIERQYRDSSVSLSYRQLDVRRSKRGQAVRLSGSRTSICGISLCVTDSLQLTTRS